MNSIAKTTANIYVAYVERENELLRRHNYLLNKGLEILLEKNGDGVDGGKTET